MDADAVEDVLTETARDHPCPTPALHSYADRVAARPSPRSAKATPSSTASTATASSTRSRPFTSTTLRANRGAGKPAPRSFRPALSTPDAVQEDREEPVRQLVRVGPGDSQVYAQFAAEDERHRGLVVEVRAERPGLAALAEERAEALS